MPYRHPSVLANIAATVDVISGGRLIIGLGAGWNQDESDALGIRLPPLKERFDQFEEGVQVIVKLLSEGPRVVHRAGTSRSPTRGASRSRCSARTRRSPSAATASGARCASSPSTPSTGTRRSATSPNGSAKGEVLDRHCADVGRDPARSSAR